MSNNSIVKGFGVGYIFGRLGCVGVAVVFVLSAMLMVVVVGVTVIGNIAGSMHPGEQPNLPKCLYDGQAFCSGSAPLANVPSQDFLSESTCSTLVETWRQSAGYMSRGNLPYSYQADPQPTTDVVPRQSVSCTGYTENGGDSVQIWFWEDGHAKLDTDNKVKFDYGCQNPTAKKGEFWICMSHSDSGDTWIGNGGRFRVRAEAQLNSKTDNPTKEQATRDLLFSLLDKISPSGPCAPLPGQPQSACGT